MIVSLPAYTLVHVFLSLIGVFGGLVVVGGLMAGVRFDRWVMFFFVTTVLTNLTGFGFPFKGVTPAHVVGTLSLVVLPVAIAALYWKRLDGAWRKVFVVLTVLGLWLNVFVLLAQIFQKTPILAALAPDPGAPAFARSRRASSCCSSSSSAGRASRATAAPAWPAALRSPYRRRRPRPRRCARRRAPATSRRTPAR